MNNPGIFSDLGTFGVLLTLAVSIATFLFWMIVAWRAMRAHERIASSLEDRLPR